MAVPLPPDPPSATRWAGGLAAEVTFADGLGDIRSGLIEANMTPGARHFAEVDIRAGTSNSLTRVLITLQETGGQLAENACLVSAQWQRIRIPFTPTASPTDATMKVEALNFYGASTNTVQIGRPSVYRANAPKARGATFWVDVAVAHSDLASAATKTLLAALAGQQVRIRNMRLSGGGTNFSGGGGDRDISIQDSSGTVVYSVIPAATAQSLAFSRWGDTGLPAPATAADHEAPTTAGEALVATYAGGATDYTAGSLTLSLELERV